MNSWQRRRSGFNHDWLKNKFLVKLNAALNLLDDRIEDPELEKTLVEDAFAQWHKHHNEAVELAMSFELDMSPATLFDQPPLVNCDEETKQWLAQLVHELWMVREPVKEWIRQTECLSAEAEKFYQELESVLRSRCTDTRSAAALRPFYNHFREWRDSCQKLANVISQFPNSIKIA